MGNMGTSHRLGWSESIFWFRVHLYPTIFISIIHELQFIMKLTIVGAKMMVNLRMKGIYGILSGLKDIEFSF